MTTVPITDSSLVDLILFFAENDKSKKGKLSPADMKKYLLMHGYSEKQIEDASGIFSSQLRKSSDRSARSVRIFSTEELSSFTPDAAELLFKLQRLGLLNYEQFESLILRSAFTIEDRLTLDEMKIMVAIIFSTGDEKLAFQGQFIHQNEDTFH